MNRRSFFKAVTGFVVGIFATSAKSKEDFPIPADPLKDKFVLNHMHVEEWAKQKYLTCGGKNGTLCPRCKFNDCRWPNYCKLNRLRIEAAEKAANPPYVLFDDSKTIQEAIDLAKNGGVVYFPKGTYNLKYGIIV